MTLAKVLTQLLGKAGDWALCSHSSSFEARALISELATAARSHPASDVGLHRQSFVLLFSISTLQAHSAKATSSQGPSANTASLAAAGLGNAQWGWHGKSKSHLPSDPHSLLAPGKAQRAAQAGVAKPQALDYKSLRPWKHFTASRVSLGFSSIWPIYWGPWKFGQKWMCGLKSNFTSKTHPLRALFPALRVSSAIV